MAEPVKKFSFFASFYEAAQDLDDTKRLALYDAMTAYVFKGTEPSLDGVLGIIWKLMKPNIDSSIAGQITGGKGGRPKKENPPFKPSVNTPSKTNMDMDGDMENGKDTESCCSLEQQQLSDNASGGAVAAKAAPPSAKKPVCPECGGSAWPNINGRFECKTHGEVDPVYEDWGESNG